jgi:predicted secreted protein
MVRPLIAIRLAVLAACLLMPGTLAAAETILHLSETATVMAAPDELAATLRAEATNRSAVEAQKAVNTAMQAAVARAKQVAGVTVSTGGYGVWHVGPDAAAKIERWQASQTLNLTSHDGAALLTLVGELQQSGLVVGNLHWQLSRDAGRTAHQDATKQALTALRGRIDEAAELLGLRFGQFKSVRLDGSHPQPAFRAMAAPMAMAAAPAPPPTAVAEDVPVSATAEADAILLPRQ